MPQGLCVELRRPSTSNTTTTLAVAFLCLLSLHHQAFTSAAIVYSRNEGPKLEHTQADEPDSLTAPVVALDGSLTTPLSSAHPFYSAFAQVSRPGRALTVYSTLHPDFYISFSLDKATRQSLNPNSCFQVDYVEMTSSIILVGMSCYRADNKTYERVIYAVGCQELYTFPEYGGFIFCRQLELVQAFDFPPLPWTLKPPAPSGGTTKTRFPQQYFTISRNSSLIVTVLDASCILTYRLKNDSQRTWVPAKELVCDNLPSERVWGVSFTRGARQDQLHLVVLNDDGHWSIRGLVWVSDTNTWHFYWVSLNFEEASAVDSVLSLSLLGEDDRWVALCVERPTESDYNYNNYGDGNRDSFGGTAYDGLTTAKVTQFQSFSKLRQNFKIFFNALACNSGSLNTIPRTSLAATLPVLFTKHPEELETFSSYLIWSSPYTPSSWGYRFPIQISFLVHSMTPVQIFPNTRQPSVFMQGATSFTTQPDAVVFFFSTDVHDPATYPYAIYATPPGFESAPMVATNREVAPVPCLPGFFKSTNNDLSSCLPCPAGTYQPAPGQASCIPCPSSALYCPSGTSGLRPRSTVRLSKTTNMSFPIASVQSTPQQRMVSAVFNPFSLAPSQSFLSAKQQFFALVLTAVGGLIINILFHIVRSTGRARRPIEQLLRLDAFREPALHPRERRIIKQGSLIGLFYTFVGVAAMIMCLWFAIGYYNSYVTYLLVPTQNTPIADLNATLGLNNDNSIRLETREGGSGDQLSIIDSIQRNVIYRVNIRLIDVRPLLPGGTSVSCEFISILVKVSGCYTQTGRECQSVSWASRLIDTDGEHDCILAAEIETPHTLAEVHVIDTTLSGVVPFFTGMVATLITSCPNLTCEVAVAEFAMDHGIEVSSNETQFVSSPMVIPTSTSAVIRETQIDSSGPFIRQAYYAASTPALHTFQAISLSEWFTTPRTEFVVSFKVTETPFWSVQKTTRAATQTDMAIVLVLQGVALFSALRIVVSITTLLADKIPWPIKCCCRSCSRRRKSSSRRSSYEEWNAINSGASLDSSGAR